MTALTLNDLGAADLAGRRVLVRVDYNVPLDEGGEVGDDGRIRATLPTLNHLTEAGARMILCAHLGRPNGAPDPNLSLRPVAERLHELIGRPVRFSEETVGAEAEAAARSLGDGELLLLENTRFHAGEMENDPAFSNALARLADLYVNDAFGAAHRAHASTAGVAKAIRKAGGVAVAGHLLARELEMLSTVLEDPERPFVAILGGAKISGKIEVIRALLPKVDRLLIGGAMANTFFRAMGLETGRSLVEEDRVEMARALLEEAGDALLLPSDVVVAAEVKAGARTESVPREGIPANRLAVDVGPDTVRRFGDEIAAARTVLWNGPMGVFEISEFSQGTRGVAEALAAATDRGATTVVGGGDSAAALTEMKLADRVTHLSTGGGASLEFMEGRTLPGVAALSSNANERTDS